MNYRSQWRPIASQNEENGIYQSVEYMDPTGESLEWHSVIRPEVETPDDDVSHSRDDPPVMLFDNFENPITEEVMETVGGYSSCRHSHSFFSGICY